MASFFRLSDNVKILSKIALALTQFLWWHLMGEVPGQDIAVSLLTQQNWKEKGNVVFLQNPALNLKYGNLITVLNKNYK